MRSILLLAPALALLLGTAASAGRVEKTAARMAEADSLARDILAGRNVNAAVSRASFLGQQRTVIERLARHANSPDPRVRRDIAYAYAHLAGIGDERALLLFAQDEEGAARMYAAKGLGRVGSRALDVLEPLLKDKSVGVRREAAKAMGLMRQPSNGPRLLAVAQHEGDPEARAAMLIAVGTSGDRKSAGALEGYLTHSSESTRFAAAQALCVLGAGAGFDFARKMLASQDRYERRQAVALFEGAKAKVAGPLLKPLLLDPDRTVAATSARILHQGGEPLMLEWLVMASWKSSGEEKLAYERQLEELALTDEQRKTVLRAQGIK